MNALIYCNGERLSKTVFRSVTDAINIFIAADGGGYHLLYHGITPDVIIGDLDSFRADPPAKTKLLKIADQETNDMEKALNYAEKKGVKKVLIAGATGQRLDHSLKNISVLLQFHSKFEEIALFDDFGKHFISQKHQLLNTRPGQVISLFPITGKVSGISTKGLKYNLNDEALQNGVRDGSSNEAIGEKAEIHFFEGELLISLEHQW